MSQNINGSALIYAERPQQCDMCGKVDDLRPYGPNGECVCFDCGMKNKRAARIACGMKLFGASRAEAEAVADKLEEKP